MVLPCKKIGEAHIYGEWDDVMDYQFIVIWGNDCSYVNGKPEAVCTVLILSGFDYGGGVTTGSDKIPYKEAEAIINADLPMYRAKEEMTTLVELYKTDPKERG